MCPPEGAEVRGAMGLRLVGDRVPGLHPAPDPSLPAVVVERVADGVPEAPEWADAGGEVTGLLRRSWGDGRPFLKVERAADTLRIWADGYGAVRVRGDGEGLRWAPPTDADPSLATRLLFSQGLPLAATLRGVEVLHGGAAVVDGRLVAVVAASGTGKSSTLAHLVAGGGEPFADDVLGLRLDGDVVWAHPGPRQANVAREQLDAMSVAGRARLGAEVGESDKVHLEPPERLAAAALPLELLVLLERGGVGARPVVEPAPQLARRLLGNAYLDYVQSPERLIRQLDVASALARSVRVLRVGIGDGEPASAVAERVRRVASGEGWAGT